MGGEPPLRPEDEEKDESTDDARTSWFARQLGEEWRSEGDGIYRFVEQTSPSEASLSSEEPPADRAARIEEVSDALAPTARLHQRRFSGPQEARGS